MLATGARLAVGPAGGTMGAGRGSMAAQLWNREAASRTHRRPAAADGCGDCAGPGRQLCRRALAQPDWKDIKNPLTGKDSQSPVVQFSADRGSPRTLESLSVPFEDLSDGEKCFIICALVLAANGWPKTAAKVLTRSGVMPFFDTMRARSTVCASMFGRCSSRPSDRKSTRLNSATD